MMWRRALLSLALVGACLWCVAVVRQVHSEESRAAKPDAKDCYKPVTPVNFLMEAQQEHWNQVVDRIRSRKGEPDAAEAKVKEDFKIMERHAYVLGELANVNQFHSEKEDYRAWAVEMRDLCVALARAAREQDLRKADELGRRIHSTCNACHAKYE